MICSHCGAENKDDALKCVQCGANLKPAADKEVKKKSSAASRIRKISVERRDSRKNPGHKKVSENTLQDLTIKQQGPFTDEKNITVEDTLDLSKFHFENLDLKETNLEEGDLQEEDFGPVNGAGADVKDFPGQARPDHRSSKRKSKLRWIIVGIVLALIIVAAAVFIYIWKNPKKDYADIILEGNRYYREANYGKAEATYEEALKMNPGGVEGYFCLADVYTAMNDPDKAIEILNRGYEATKNEQLRERIDELTGGLSESAGDSRDSSAPGETQNDSDGVSDAGSVPENASNVIVWSVDPALEADTIMPVLGCSYEDDVYSCGVSMIVDNGLTGLIDNNGKMVAQPQFMYVLLCSGQLYAAMPDGSTHLLNEDYTVNEESAHNHSMVSYDYLWDDSQKAIFRIVNDSEGSRVEENPYVPEENSLVPVIRGTSGQYSLDNAVYALAGSQGLRTDFVYANTGKVFSDGMIAVFRDGKWGFCNGEGVEVIPCEYEGADYVRTDSSEKVSYAQGMPYGYSEGFAALKKDGVWGFVDKTGNIAVPFVFEEARPVYGGKAWVKYQGKWGIISLTGASQDQAETKTESSVSETGTTQTETAPGAAQTESGK